MAKKQATTKHKGVFVATRLLCGPFGHWQPGTVIDRTKVNTATLIQWEDQGLIEPETAKAARRRKASETALRSGDDEGLLGSLKDDYEDDDEDDDEDSSSGKPLNQNAEE